MIVADSITVRSAVCTKRAAKPDACHRLPHVQRTWATRLSPPVSTALRLSRTLPLSRVRVERSSTYGNDVRMMAHFPQIRVPQELPCRRLWRLSRLLSEVRGHRTYSLDRAACGKYRGSVPKIVRAGHSDVTVSRPSRRGVCIGHCGRTRSVESRRTPPQKPLAGIGMVSPDGRWCDRVDGLGSNDQEVGCGPHIG